MPSPSRDSNLSLTSWSSPRIPILSWGQGELVRTLKARRARGDSEVTQEEIALQVAELVRLKKAFHFRC